MKKFRGAIFDMDGTLLDSMYIWRHLAPEYLRKNNIPIPDDLNAQMNIMGIRRAVEFLISSFHLPLSSDELYEELIAILADFYRTRAVFKPGAVRFLERLQQKNIPMMIFSATPEHLLHLVLERLDAVKYFSRGLLSCHTIKCTKNQEDAFLTAAAHLGVPAEDVMIFEDAWYAASTAKRAGFALGIMADQQEIRTEDMRDLADFYVEKSWDEFPVDRFF